MLFQPSNVTPGTLAGSGNYTIDASDEKAVFRFGLNGNSGLKIVDYVFYDMENDENVFVWIRYTPVAAMQPRNYAGEQNFFTHTFTKAEFNGEGTGITVLLGKGNWFENGHDYKYRIVQTYEDGTSQARTEQLDFNVFYARADPVVTIADQSITSHEATVAASYTQEQGDGIGFVRWEVYDGDGNSLYDTGEMNTQELLLYIDGLEDGSTYTVKLSGETENGVAFETSRAFEVSYRAAKTHVGPKCYRCCNTGAIMVEAKKPVLAQYEATYKKNVSVVNASYIDLLPVSDDNTAEADYKFYAPYSETEEHKFTMGFYVTLGGLINETGAETTAFEFVVSNIKTSGTAETQGNTVDFLGMYNRYDGKFDFYVNVYEDAGSQPETVIIGAAVEANPNGAEIEFLCGTDGAVLIVNGVSYAVESDKLSASFTTYHKGGYMMVSANLETVVSWACLYKDTELADILQRGTVAPDIEEDNICFVTSAYTEAGEDVIACEADATLTDLSAFITSLSENMFKTIFFRREAGAKMWDRLCGDTVYTASESVSRIMDYGAKQNVTYDYSISYIFGAASETGISDKVFRITTCGWNYTILEAKLYNEWSNKNVGYDIVKEYNFALDAEQGAISNNNSPNILNNFTRYPSRQAVAQNYRSGTLSAYIGKVNSQKMCYVDTADQAQAIYDLSTSTYTKFLKTRKGELFMIETAGETSMTVGNQYKEQPYSASLSWVEIGDASACFIVNRDPTEDDYGELIEAANEYVGNNDYWLWDLLDFDNGSIPEDE